MQAKYAQEVISDAPRAFWKCQELSGNPQDSSGNAYHMTTVTGSPTYGTPGPFGADTSIDIAGGGKQFTKTGVVTTNYWNFTLEAWLRWSSGAMTFLVNGSTAGIGLNVTSGGKLKFDSYGTAVGPDSATTLVAGTWYHFVVTDVSGTGACKYYVNGAFDLDAGTPGVSNPSGDTWLGKSTETCDIRLGWCAIYESVLPVDRISAHYQAGIYAFESRAGRFPYSTPSFSG